MEALTEALGNLNLGTGADDFEVKDPEWLKSCQELESLRDYDKSVRESKDHELESLRDYDKSVRESKKHVGRYQIVDGEVLDKEGGEHLSNDLAGRVSSRLVAQRDEIRRAEQETRSRIEEELAELRKEIENLYSPKGSAFPEATSDNDMDMDTELEEAAEEAAGVNQALERPREKADGTGIFEYEMTSVGLVRCMRTSASEDVSTSGAGRPSDRFASRLHNIEMTSVGFVRCSNTDSTDDDFHEGNSAETEHEGRATQSLDFDEDTEEDKDAEEDGDARFDEAEALWEQYFAKKSLLAKKQLPKFKADVDNSDVEEHGGARFHEAEALWEQYFARKSLLAKKQLPKFKADVDNSGSTWTVSSLSKHLAPREIEHFAPNTAHPRDLPNSLVSSIMKQTRAFVECIHGWTAPGDDSETGLDNLCSTQMLEAVSRTFIDAVVLPIARLHKIQVSMEESLKSEVTVNNKFDYLLFKKGRYFGVVEAKRVGASFTKAFVQTSLQLFLLRCKDTQTSLDVDRSPGTFAEKIGVITNGESYVFVKLLEDVLQVSDVFRGGTVEGLEQIIYALHHMFSG